MSLRVAFKTFGCRLNQAETARMRAQFEALGWHALPFGKPADAIVLHGCAVTQNAESEVLRTARRLRETGTALVILTGCIAPAARDKANAAAHLVIPNEEKENIAQQVTDLTTRRLDDLAKKSPPCGKATPSATNLAISPQPPALFSTSRALLKIQDGCNFRCAYCIVPDTRGEPRSRPLADCQAEAADLATRHNEIVITGCNIACWQHGDLRLPDLLRALAAGLPYPAARLRLGSIEPGTMERAVIDLMADTPAICRFLHLPLQHADPAMLRAMRRRYTIDHYRAAADHALARIPGLALGADVITGFPGETDAAFAALRGFIEETPFSNLHVFPYSERPGTPAAAFPGAVPPHIRKARAAELIALARVKRHAFATAHIGRPQRVLIERIRNGTASGWTDTYISCRFPWHDASRCHTIVDVTPTRVEGDILFAD